MKETRWDIKRFGNGDHPEPVMLTGERKNKIVVLGNDSVFMGKQVYGRRVDIARWDSLSRTKVELLESLISRAEDAIDGLEGEIRRKHEQIEVAQKMLKEAKREECEASDAS